METTVYLEVEEVFRDEHGHLWPGKLMAYEEPAGEIRLDGVRLCTVPEPGRTLQGAGDRVLAFGAQPVENGVRLDVSWVYPVRDGEIMPQPAVPESGIEPVPMVRFREISRAVNDPDADR